MSRVVLLSGRHGLRLLGRSLRLLGQLVGLEREREREMRLVYSWLKGHFQGPLLKKVLQQKIT